MTPNRSSPGSYEPLGRPPPSRVPGSAFGPPIRAVSGSPVRSFAHILWPETAGSPAARVRVLGSREKSRGGRPSGRRRPPTVVRFQRPVRGEARCTSPDRSLPARVPEGPGVRDAGPVSSVWQLTPRKCPRDTRHHFVSRRALAVCVEGGTGEQPGIPGSAVRRSPPTVLDRRRTNPASPERDVLVTSRIGLDPRCPDPSR
jgi:hypothetical protein